MMEPVVIAAALAGLVAGGIASWLIVRSRMASAAALAQLAAEAERAQLATKLETAIEDGRKLAGDIDSLRRQLDLELARAAAANAIAERVPGLEARIATLADEAKALAGSNAALDAELRNERESAAEKLRLLDEARLKLADAFKALSAEALKNNNESFLDLARESLAKSQQTSVAELEKRQQAIAELLSPIRTTLEKFDQNVQQIEKDRVGAYEGLRQQIGMLHQTGDELRRQTANLVQALRSPAARGRWGEIQLRRVVEMAGMLPYCDFVEKQSTNSEGGRLVPDMLINLPGGKTVIVDAKTPLEGYLRAVEATSEEERQKGIEDHARHVRTQMKLLGSKAYWDQFDASPEFVVMFLPGEALFSAALQHDPSLIEAGVDDYVIPATPTTLIALLRAVAYGWQQQRLSQNLQDIQNLGRELFERLATMGDHLRNVGNSLGGAVGAYNKAIGSLESRVMVTARRFKDLDAAPTAGVITELKPVDSSPRSLTAPELLADSADEAKPASESVA